MINQNWNSAYTSRLIRTVIIVAVVVGIRIYYDRTNTDPQSIQKNNDAVAAAAAGNTDQAIIQFQQAANTASSNETKIAALKNLGYSYDTKGDTDNAKKAFAQALALANKDSFDFYLTSGNIALLNAYPKTADIDFKQAYKLDPNDFQINNSLADFYMDIDDTYPDYANPKEALMYAKKAYELNPADFVKQNLGAAYMLNGDYDNAISTFQTVTLDKDTYVAYYIGLAYVKKGDAVNAKKYLQTAVDNGVKVPQDVLDFLKKK